MAFAIRRRRRESVRRHFNQKAGGAAGTSSCRRTASGSIASPMPRRSRRATAPASSSHLSRLLSGGTTAFQPASSAPPACWLNCLPVPRGRLLVELPAGAEEGDCAARRGAHEQQRPRAGHPWRARTMRSTPKWCNARPRMQPPNTRVREQQNAFTCSRLLDCGQGVPGMPWRAYARNRAIFGFRLHRLVASAPKSTRPLHGQNQRCRTDYPCRVNVDEMMAKWQAVVGLAE